MSYEEGLANIIEGRILAEKRKHPTLDWIKIASIKIANDIIHTKSEMFDKMLDPEVIAKYGKTQDERMAITKYIRLFKALIGGKRK